ncbi:MAG TPA: hypothetical protein VKY54_05165, partial [Kiloniellales bacterium]|nr:hypothetical protein [Kiloniellales bacterium]
MSEEATTFSARETHGEQQGYPPGVAWLEGRYLPIAEARIPILDWGFLRSDATYDVVHVWKGK